MNFVVGRNDPCFCGSGRKYKNCCLRKLDSAWWRDAASKVDFQHPKRAAVQSTFFTVSDFLREEPRAGACHLLSAILYLLLAEQDIDSVLMIGEVLRPDGKYFDHSWVEVGGQVFDVAIQLTLVEVHNPPVFAGIDLGTSMPTELTYGAHSPAGLDADLAAVIQDQPLGEYMDEFPESPSGAWPIVQRLARRLNLTTSTASLRGKYWHVNRATAGGGRNSRAL